MTGKLIDLSLGLNRKHRITLELDQDFMEAYGQLQGKPLDIEIRKHREKRSLDANAYFWSLLRKLAGELHTTVQELYLGYVRDYGPYRDWPLPPELTKTFQTAWSRQGKGWPTEVLDYTPDGRQIIIRAYYGSSTYNTKQMSRLIDAVVEDCKAQGIETLTPDKLDAMKERWKCAQGDEGDRDH